MMKYKKEILFLLALLLGFALGMLSGDWVCVPVAHAHEEVGESAELIEESGEMEAESISGESEESAAVGAPDSDPDPSQKPLRKGKLEHPAVDVVAQQALEQAADDADKDRDLTQKERRMATVGEDKDPLNLFFSYDIRSSGGVHEQSVRLGWFSTRLLAVELRGDLLLGQPARFRGTTFDASEHRGGTAMGGVNWVFGNKLRTLVYGLGGVTIRDRFLPVVEVGTRTFSPNDARIQLTTVGMIGGDEELTIGAEISVELDFKFIKLNDAYFDLGYHWRHYADFEKKQWNIGVSTYFLQISDSDPLRARINVITDEAIGLWGGFEWAF